MFRSFLTPAAALLAVANLLAGCAAQPDNIRGPQTAAPDPVPVALYPNLTFRGDLSQRLVRLGEPTVIPATPRRPMRVVVRLRNTTDAPVYVQYRFRFYGPDRDPLDVDMPWQAVALQPTLAADFNANSTQVRASEWELEVRPQ